MKVKLKVLIFICVVTATPVLPHKKPVQNSKVTFSVVYLDRLNNTNNGIPPKSLKDVENKLTAYGDVCYVAHKKGDLVFFIHTAPVIYHGTHVYTDDSNSAAAVTDENGNSATAAASSSSSTAVPYTVDLNARTMLGYERGVK